MRKFIKKIKNSLIGKILRILFKLIIWLLEIIIIFMAIVIVVQRVSNSEKAFLGIRIFSVSTGSMEPEYGVGDVLISREVDPSTIKVGDNIVYLGDEDGVAGKIITHSVIEIEQDENGEYLFHTQGRANTVEDPVVSEDQIYGLIVQNNIVLAKLWGILNNRYGLYLFVVFLILQAFVEFVKSQGEKVEFEREAKREEKITKKKRKKTNKMEENEDIREEEEKIRTPKKERAGSATAKKKIVKEDKEEESAEIEEKPKTKTKSNSGAKTKTTTKTKVAKNTTDSETKTKATKSAKSNQGKKSEEVLKKTTKTKKAKEE